MNKPGRNDPCQCGSGKKYKHCCGSVQNNAPPAARMPSGGTSLQELLQTGLGHHQAGRLPQAESFYREILGAAPDHPDALYLSGLAAHESGRSEAAVELIGRAIRINPAGSFHYTLGNIFRKLGRLDEAAVNYSEALRLIPNLVEAHVALGNTLKAQNRPGEAAEHFRKALKLKPDLVEAHLNLGNALRAQGKLDEAIKCFLNTIRLKPDYAEAYNNLGSALREQDDLDGAIENFRKALALKPDMAGAHNNLGGALQKHGKLEEAIDSFAKALELRPDYLEAGVNLGNVFKEQDKLDAAIGCYRKVLEFAPGMVEVHNNLGSALLERNDRKAAAESFRKALSLDPDCINAHLGLGATYQDAGQLAEAEASYRRALEIKPDLAEAHSILLFLYAYHTLIDPREYLTQARNWEQACLPAPERQAAHHRAFQCPPLAGRRLRVGYVSGDYCQHAVSYFIEQLFAHHDRTLVELFAYSTRFKRDAVTERLQAMVEHWVPVAGMPDAATRDRIEADGIDVLIDLSGHTAHSRLGIFARRAAPVQAHYLGYFASTGLTEMDYWIGDEILTPAETDSHFSEQVWRLPRVWVSYNDKTDAPLSDWHPAQDGSVWLGSFNNLGKLTPATLALWAKVLHALPEGKLLLKTKALNDIGNQQLILDAMAGHGISPSRIELQGSNVTPDWPAHMAYYNRLDIALDPVGAVGGGTTTCDALWMEVPVITLEGDRMASRMTASMLNAIDRPEWTARTDAEYIDKVVALARDAEQRKALRSGQRNRMASSPLCDARGLAKSMENAYFEMFEQWIDNKSR